MENITIGQIVAVCGTLSVLAGFFIGIYKFIKATVLNKIEKNTEDIRGLQKEMEEMKKDIEDSKEERLILLKGQLACLKGLQEQGCNGIVTKTINDLENYILNKAHE